MFSFRALRQIAPVIRFFGLLALFFLAEKAMFCSKHFVMFYRFASMLNVSFERLIPFV